MYQSTDLPLFDGDLASFLPLYTSSEAENRSIDVYFFCSDPNHYPNHFAKKRCYECPLCPEDITKSHYFCSECFKQKKEICHYAAKHINNHMKNMHDDRKVERKFAESCPEIRDTVLNYKQGMSSGKKRKAERNPQSNKKQKQNHNQNDPSQAMALLEPQVQMLEPEVVSVLDQEAFETMMQMDTNMIPVVAPIAPTFPVNFLQRTGLLEHVWQSLYSPDFSMRVTQDPELMDSIQQLAGIYVSIEARFKEIASDIANNPNVM